MTIIEQVGCDVTLRQITRTFNDYGDATESNSDSTITAWIVPARSFDQDLKSGILQEKDCVGFFKASDTAKIKDGNKVQYNSVWYGMKNVTPILISSSIHHIEADLVALIES